MGQRQRPKPGQGERVKGRGPVWDAGQVRALRRHLGVSQQGLAQEMGTRQQTVSEWETGRYRPRGASVRLLAIIAERARYRYGAESQDLEAGKGDEPRDRGEESIGQLDHSLPSG